MKQDFDKAEIAKLEQIANCEFKDIALLKQAFTHSSAIANQPRRNSNLDYERLEFLGDRILGLVIAELLYENFTDASEGELSKRLNSLVNTDICADIICNSGLADFVRVGDELRRNKTNPYRNIYADIMEAFIAVLYKEAGFAKVKDFVLRYWGDLLYSKSSMQLDPKTTLQEWAHKQNGSHPIYEVLRCEGTDHDPVYYIKLEIAGFPEIVGEGRSKRLAQRDAATKFLYREKIWHK